jgi:hypothetical protein
MSETVFGVPLEPGERVVYFHREEPGWQKPALIVAGVLLAFAILGLFLLAAGLMATTECTVVTTRRVLIITRKKTEQIRLDEIKKITKRIKNGRLSWIWLERGAGQPWLSVQVSTNRGIAPVIDTLAKDPAAFAALPSVPFDASAALPEKT